MKDSNYFNDYYHKNKDRILQKRNERGNYECFFCNKVIQKYNKSNHEKTKIHKMLVEIEYYKMKELENNTV